LCVCGIDGEVRHALLLPLGGAFAVCHVGGGSFRSMTREKVSCKLRESVL
jgi:hypothetical protein